MPNAPNRQVWGPDLAQRRRADRVVPLKGERGLGLAMLNLRLTL